MLYLAGAQTGQETKEDWKPKYQIKQYPLLEIRITDGTDFYLTPTKRGVVEPRKATYAWRNLEDCDWRSHVSLDLRPPREEGKENNPSHGGHSVVIISVVRWDICRSGFLGSVD